jgi:ADP-dependent NAD(P)H-hydrate dehydratase / NAD(P)H-hydrate epimerase
MINVTKDILKIIYKERPPEAKKYDYGLLLVIGGSEFYSGSPALSALAALRAGADMVHVIAPKRAADIIASFGPDLAAYPLDGKCLTEKHLSILLSMTESAKIVSHGKTAVVIGGGAGRSEETKKTIKDYLSQISIPAVIDADAIHAIAENPELISKKTFLITPHSFEFFILTGKEINDLSLEEKIKVVQEEAKNLGVTILLKGKTDIISDGKETALSNTGSPYMSIGGTGDSLAGIAGSLMAQGFDPFLAAQAAAFINGKAGELAAKTKKESMLTTDLIEALSKVLH